MLALAAKVGLWIALAVAAGGAFLVPHFRRWIDNRIAGQVQLGFDQKREDYKHQLALAADVLRFDQQRRVSSYSHFASKRHEAYAELWSRLRTAHGRALDLGRHEDQKFEFYDETDVEGYLQRRGVPSGMRKEILETWSVSRSDGVDALNAITRSTDRHQAQTTFVEANNYFVDHELYLSSEVSELVGQIITGLDRLRFALVRAQEPLSRDAMEDEVHFSRRAVTDLLDKLRSVMRTELMQTEAGEG